jgi:hypothetical protein
MKTFCTIGAALSRVSEVGWGDACDDGKLLRVGAFPYPGSHALADPSLAGREETARIDREWK